VVRRDIRSSVAGLSGTAEGIPLTVTLTDRVGKQLRAAGRSTRVSVALRPAGRYSLYLSGVTDQNYLRGVQEADADGKVTFTTIFPRAIRTGGRTSTFEVYPSLAAATSASSKGGDLAAGAAESDLRPGLRHRGL
jgi:hypothetical protein